MNYIGNLKNGFREYTQGISTPTVPISYLPRTHEKETSLVEIKERPGFTMVPAVSGRDEVGQN